VEHVYVKLGGPIAAWDFEMWCR